MESLRDGTPKLGNKHTEERNRNGWPTGDQIRNITTRLMDKICTLAQRDERKKRGTVRELEDVSGTKRVNRVLHPRQITREIKTLTSERKLDRFSLTMTFPENKTNYKIHCVPK